MKKGKITKTFEEWSIATPHGIQNQRILDNSMKKHGRHQSKHLRKRRGLKGNVHNSPTIYPIIPNVCGYVKTILRNKQTKALLP